MAHEGSHNGKKCARENQEKCIIKQSEQVSRINPLMASWLVSELSSDDRLRFLLCFVPIGSHSAAVALGREGLCEEQMVFGFLEGSRAFIT